MPRSHRKKRTFCYSGQVNVGFRGQIGLQDLKGSPALDDVLDEGSYYAKVCFTRLRPKLHETSQFALLRKLFHGDVKAAERWMYSPQSTLAGKAPVECLGTARGRERVTDLINAAVHGIYT